ncbi:MAG TPA: putative Ig domain-containing protein, partial [Blastocatellia bacterium]
NSAVRSGGGIYSLNNTVNLNYSTVANNISDSDNDAVGEGGGVSRGSGSINLRSSIVAGNRKGMDGTASAMADCGGTATSRNYNLTGSGTGCSLSGTGDQTVTPSNVFTAVLGPLSDNGGPTRTHALLGGSPAFNRIPNGVNDCGLSPFNRDQRGKTRAIDTNCEIGAYETQLSILRDSASLTNASSVSWTVTFGDAVSNLSSSNFALAVAGLGGTPTITGATPIGGAPAAQWTVTASTGSGAGTLGLNMTNNTGISPAVADVPFTGQVYSIDTVRPTVAINQAAGQADPTLASPVNFTVVFSKSVTGFTTGDVNLSGGAGTITATVSEIAPNDGTTYNVAVTGMSTSGTVSASIAENAASDAAGNGNLASTSTDNTVIFVNCLSSLTVNDLGDTADASAGNGVCADSNGNCTLRAAIEEANALTACSSLTINFSVTGTISLATALPNLNHPNLTISGPGAASLTVQRSTASGTANFRIFSIGSGKTVAISGLTIANGYVSTDGGGITNFGSLTITDCAIRDNYANGGGGILNVAILNMSNSTLSGNSAGFDGAGVYNINGTASLTNCTISANTSVGGGSGGIESLAYSGFSASLSLTNCTVTGNSGSKIIDVFIYPGGIASTAQLRNTLVAGNSGKNFEFPGTTQVTSLGNNLDSDGTSGFTNGANGNLVGTAGRKINALLSPLGDYGGTTQTHALLPGSPAINAGTASGAPTNDQRGSSRAGAVDIGAFESQGFTLAVTGGNNQSATVPTVFASALAVSVSSSFGEPVNGGQVAFTQPASGASATITGSPASLNASGEASVTAQANSTTGSYNVAASTSGAPSVNFSLTNTCQTITVTAPATNTGAAGAAISAAFTQSGGIGATTFNTSSTLPTGITLSSGGLLSGSTTQTGAFPITVKATDSNGCMGTASYTLTIGCPNVTLSALPAGIAGTSYGQTLTASPAGGGYSFAVTSGGLPPGLSLSAGGALTGTPTAAGTFDFTIRATGGGGCTGSQAYSLVVSCPALTLSPMSLPNAAVNSPYSQTVSAMPSGTAYSFSVTSGALPAGLMLNSSTGEISGSATQTGTFNFRVAAAGWGNCTGFRDYSLAVGCAAVTVNPSSLPGGSIGAGYNQNVSALPAGTYSYTVSSGALPAGLMLNAATGAITGTPVASGSYNFTISADTNAGGGGCSGSRGYTVVIGCQTISFTTTALPAGAAGSSYSQTLAVTPAGAYTFSLVQGSLPTGVTLNTTTGVLSGLPTATGTYNFAVKAQAANGCSVTQTYSLAINCPAVTLTLEALPGGATGMVYSQNITVSPSGGGYSFAVTTGVLPAGLTLNSATGVLSGTPAANGSFTFTVTATGFGSCAGSKQYTVVIGNGGCPAISLPASLPAGSAGQLYNSSAAASPSGSYSYTFTGSLPPGVTLYGSLGVLVGYPTANGTYNFTLTATNANNCTASQSYSVMIGAGSLAVTNDFSGDRRSDFTLWRATEGQWLIVDGATDAARTVSWGRKGDRTMPGDYDGDGKTDLAVFGQDGHWRIKQSSNDATLDTVWGLGTDIPVPGDYDGDGKTDLAVWRGAESGWHIQRSSDGQTESLQWGTSRAPYLDVPVPGDYDGDGKTDVAVFRQANGHWYIRRSSDGRTVDKAWGLGTDVPVPGDFDGDGKTDIAVWRGSEGDWHIVRSSDGAVESKFWGAAYTPYFDTPAVGDYDGDGRADVAVWRKSDGHWYVLQSSDGATRVVAQGRSGDAPVVAQPRP